MIRTTFILIAMLLLSSCGGSDSSSPEPALVEQTTAFDETSFGDAKFN